MNGVSDERSLRERVTAAQQAQLPRRGPTPRVTPTVSVRMARAARRAQLVDNAELIRKSVASTLTTLDEHETTSREQHTLIVLAASQLAVLQSVLESVAEA
ncbi:MAG: hypothetical protein WBD41_07725 [Rhodococcus sp. (in: high G+C Gram-positive bacteria)]